MSNNQKKNFIWNTIGLTAYCFVSFLLLIVINNINGSNLAGVFSYSFSICTLFLYISLYFNRTFQITENKNSFNQFLTTRIFTCTISFISIALFSIISGFSFYKLLIILIIMMFRITDAISDTFYGYFQKRDQLYIVGISYFIKSTFSIIVFIIADYLTKNLLMSLTLFLVIYIITTLLYDYRLFKKDNKETINIDFSNTRIILSKSFPIFLFQFISIYLSNCSKYIMTYFVTNELQAVFGILIMPATLLSLVGNYLIQPFVKVLNDLKVNGEIVKFNKTVRKILLVLFALGIIICVAGNFFGISILEFIYKSKLSNYKNELLIILISAIFNSASMILSGVLTVLNKNKVQVYFYLVCSFITTLIGYYLIKNGTNPIYEVTISYFVSCISLFALFIVYYLRCIKQCKKGSEINE